MNGSTTELGGFLAASRALWRRRTVARGALRGVLAGACAVVVLLGAAALELVPAASQPWLRWAPLLLVAVLPLLGLLRALVRTPSERSFALRAEEAVPELEHLPTTLLDLPQDHPYAPDLERRAGDRLRGVGPGRLFNPISSRGGALGGALIALLAMVALTTSGGPTTVWAAWGGSVGLQPGAGPTPSSAPDGRPEPLAGLTVRVVPPGYTGLSAMDAPLDGVVTAIAGSRVELSGTGGGPGLDVALVRGEGDRMSLPLRRESARWASGWTLEAGDRGVVLTDDEGRERVVPLSALDDPPPTVELVEPERDFVLATGTGAIDFHARATDPLGLADFQLTWVHTRGSGESFDFREGTASWTSRERTTDGVEGQLVLNLADLELGPGDVLHLRAVATDRNDVTGPGTGVSETRQIRIIREGDEMSVDALVGFPLELDQRPVLSQRMILLMTEELLERAPELTPSAFRAEAEAIGDEQARLRAQVADQIYSRATGAMETVDTHLGHEGLSPVAEADAHAHEPPPAPEPSGSRYGVASVFDPTSEEPSEREAEPIPPDPTENPDPAGTQIGSYEVGGAGALPTGFGELDDLGHDHDSDPVLSVNRPLLAIHDAMWASEGELRVIDPAASLPHQRLALERLQALRDSERVFPRGQVTVPPVDVEAARGTGELDEADPSPRSAWSGEREAARWLGRLEEVLGDLANGAPTLQGTLERLAVELVADPTVDPAVVAPVASAAERLRADDIHGARADLLEARALLDPRGERVASEAASSWPGSPSSLLASPTSAGLDGPPEERPVAEASAKPFVFATLRYESGNWDSAPLVPQNLIHTLAQYTELPVAPEGVVVDLSSSEIFEYPVLYLTGHLPVRFSSEESRNLREYVERGGFVFMDDHNHDVDGAFHRTATAELERIFGRDALEPLPTDHEIYRAFFHFEDGPPITAHELSGWGDGLIHRELFAVVRDGRIGVLYSNKDYSSEWSYHAVNKRFLAVDNTRFGVNILLYALTR